MEVSLSSIVSHIIMTSIGVFLGICFFFFLFFQQANEIFLEPKNKAIIINNKIFCLITGLISIAVSIPYVLFEENKIYEPRPLDEIDYLGVFSILFEIFSVLTLTFLMVFIVIAIITAFMNTILKKEIANQEWRKYSYLACVLLALFFTYTHFFGNEKIDSIFARDKYITQCFVNAFPDDSESKNYRLRADIRVDNGSLTSLGGKEVWILKVYFENGGYLDIQDQYEYELNKNRTFEVTDQNDKQWNIEIPRGN